MEEAPKCLEEEHAYDLREKAKIAEEEYVPLPMDIEDEEEIDLPTQPMPPPSPRRAIPGVGLGSIGTRGRQHTFPSTSSRSLTTLDGASGAVGSSTLSSFRVPPRPPISSRGKVVPFTRKRGRVEQPRGNQ
jgi:hypothetical protein